MARCVGTNARSACVHHVQNKNAQCPVEVRRKKRQDIEQRSRNGGGRNLELLGSCCRFLWRERFRDRHSILRGFFRKLRRNLSMMVPRRVFYRHCYWNTGWRAKIPVKKSGLTKFPPKFAVEKSGLTKFRGTLIR